MLLYWQIQHSQKPVPLPTEGVLTFADVTQYLDNVSAESAIGYRKLTDAREGWSDMAEDELLAYLGAVSTYTYRRHLSEAARPSSRARDRRIRTRPRAYAEDAVREQGTAGADVHRARGARGVTDAATSFR